MYGMFRNHFDYGFYKKFEDEYKQCCKEAREQRTKESGKEQEAEKLNRQQTKLIRTIVVLVALSILLYFSNFFNCAWFAGLLVIAVAALSIYSLVKFICLNKKYRIFVKPEHDIRDTNFMHIHLGPETYDDNSIPNAARSYYTKQIHMRHGK